MSVRKARVDDAPAIHALVNRFARKEKMLPLSLGLVYERLRDFFVYERRGKVRSLAVQKEYQRRGIGAALFHACIEEAPRLGVRRVFTLTFVPAFFQRMGMTLVAKETLPHKVWADCVRCPRFPNCDEVALVADLDEHGLRPPKDAAER